MRPDRKNLQQDLNRCLPAAQQANLGDVLQELIDAYNDLAEKHNAFITFFEGLTNGEFSLVSGMTAPVSLKNINDRK